jgi:hypothetical protein
MTLRPRTATTKTPEMEKVGTRTPKNPAAERHFRFRGPRASLSTMHAVGRFEEHLSRRLRYELDGMVIRVPAIRPDRQRHWSLFIYGVLSPLAIAVAATAAVMVLASAFTGSTNPVVWTDPGAWMRSTGIAPPSPSPTPSPPNAKSPSTPSSHPAVQQRVPLGVQPSGGGERESPEPGDGSHPSPTPSPSPSPRASPSPSPSPPPGGASPSPGRDH